MPNRRAYSDVVLRSARELRANQTPAERKLWGLLRNRRLENAKFRRQQPFGRYIVDFYCHDAKLVIEVDGGQHFDDEHRLYDAERTAWLESHGLKVMRFTNQEVMFQVESVMERIREELPSPRPSPAGRGSQEE